MYPQRREPLSYIGSAASLYLGLKKKKEKKKRGTISALQHLEMFCSLCDGLKRKLTATLLLLFVFEICRRGREEASRSPTSTEESFEVEFVAAELSLPEQRQIVMHHLQHHHPLLVCFKTILSC